MKAETLVHQHPPTPPEDHVHPDLHSSLHQVAQYNADRGCHYDDSPSQVAVYSSPDPAMHHGLPHGMVPSGAEYGVALQYDEYGHGPGYGRGIQYNGFHNEPTKFSRSPPTPRSSTEIEDIARRTRSGRNVVPSSSPMEETKPRPKPTPKSKKAKTGKGEKPKTPKLTAALSILTKDMARIPVRNMEEWVNRPAEARKKEVEKRNGYVTRPMNSFMLYRSAYAERTKQWCLQNNHQVVSSVSGESWPMEPPEVRELFNEYAKIERINHQNAHPTYKFSPSKAAAPARKRKREFSDDEPSDLEDAEWNPSSDRSRSRSSKRMSQGPGYPMNGMSPPEFFDQRFGPNVVNINRPGWEMTNEWRPMPMPMDDPYGQYYQTSVHPGMGMPQGLVEDMRMRRADTPISTMQLSQDTALLGLPGGNANVLMQQMHSHSDNSLPGEPHVDPLLMSFDGGHHDLGVPASHPEFRNEHMAMMEGELDGHSVDSFIGAETAHEEYRTETWQQYPNMGPMESPESEFDKWLGDQ
ncbi:HMG box protein [Paraphaeosphaeria minitans]|uniref:HMG box protein n=1 Tax=Paraphaeosphaeria minitans TaxID=565426 RepID=A0A9P6GSM4_9PLEO|nr:HMG box protein [Paraphaeosphaeria minitans]